LKQNVIKYLFPLLLMSFVLQKDGNKLMYALSHKHNYLTVDNLGNLFLVKDNEIVKYLSGGKYFNRYSNLKLGNIHFVDATNALRVMLFYKDYQQLIFLDNQLTQKRNAVSLEDMGLEQTDLVCASANNGFWLYNKANNELLRFNEALKKIASTGNLKQILQTELNPNYLTEYNNNVYLNCPETGVYIFDIFGTFSKLIPVKNIKELQVAEQIFYFATDSGFCSYNFKLFETSCRKFDNQKLKQARYVKGNIYISSQDSVFVYSQD